MNTHELPQRPKSHVTGERALLILKQSIPQQWILRELNSDYGIDCEIEIVAPCGAVMGAVVKAQVKGTSGSALGRTRGVSVSSSTVRYWMALPVPVILISVSLDPLCVHWLDVREYLIEKDRLDTLYTSKQSNYYFSLLNAHRLPEDAKDLQAIALDHQEMVMATREEYDPDVRVQFTGYLLLIKLFDGDPDKWIAYLREKGTREGLLEDLPFVYWVKDEMEKDPELLGKLRRMVEGFTQPGVVADRSRCKRATVQWTEAKASSKAPASAPAAKRYVGRQ